MMMKMRTKTLDFLLRESERQYALKKALGAPSLTALGIGAVLGFGIFVLPGIVTAHYSGSSLVLSFVLAALCCLLCGLSYAEFASAIPVAGSAYTYAYATVGEIFAWIISWLLLLGYSAIAAIIAKGWQSYFSNILNIFGSHSSGEKIIGNYVPAVFVVILLTAILARGTRESSQVNNLTVLI